MKAYETLSKRAQLLRSVCCRCLSGVPDQITIAKEKLYIYEMFDNYCNGEV